MAQTLLTQPLFGRAHVVTSLGQSCDFETQSCLLHETIEISWGPVRFSLPLIVLLSASVVGISRQKTLRGKLGIDVMARAVVASRSGYYMLVVYI